MLRTTYTILLTMFAMTAMASQLPAMPDVGDYRSEIIRQKSVSKIDASIEASKVGPVRAMPNIDVQQTHGVDIDQIATRYKQMGKKSADENLLVFVSMSMPMTALVKLGKQASQAGAVMVLRGIPGGLERGAWNRAMAKLKPVIDTGASIQIHPDMYQLYGVKQVPTFVLARAEQSECVLDSTRCQAFLKASGDVTLDYVLDRWADGKDELADKARVRLDRISGDKK